jgi:hypothetical protein
MTGEPTTGEQTRQVDARCMHCGTSHQFEFDSPGGGEIGRVNIGDQPSQIIDLGQWLALFYLSAESASRTSDRAEARRLTFQAAECLDEALKFYPPGADGPPESALFIDSSRTSFQQHPERFARQRLRDLRGKLPDLHVMARRLQRDNRPPPRRWWQFWKKR